MDHDTNLTIPAPAGPMVREEPPFVARNSDQSVNYGSYQVLAGCGVVNAADTALREATGEVPSVPQVKRLARLLLYAADRVQAAVRSDGHVDRMAGSHTRARGAVHSAIEAYPVPIGASEDEQAEWLDRVVERATQLVQLGAFLAFQQFPTETAATEDRSVA